MSLFSRIALAGAGLLALALLAALLLWRPASEASFVARTDGLLRGAGRDFEAIATSLVDRTMEFAAASALHADRQRALAVQDIPFELFTDAEGRLEEGRLRETLRAAVVDPSVSGAAKHGAVRAEIQQWSRAEVQRRLAALRAAQASIAERHASENTGRTAAAWAGMLLLLLAGWTLVLDRVVLRPLREATSAVGRFGGGERGVRLEPGGAAEIAALGRAFNETAAAVERTERENADLRAGLEQKVKERTDALVRAARASTAGTMAGGVAHEFNNLLGGILGCADAALEEECPPEVREAVEMICKTARRGVGVTKALLRATRATPDRAACEPAALFEEVVAETRPPAGIHVERDFVPVEIEADAAMLRQVLANLVHNAVDAMEEHGTLRLGVREAAEGIALEVSDTGPGIEESVQGILFEPFVTTRHGGREGAGLGLFLAERLVLAHGGTIEVESGPEGGTTFRVRLPRGE